MNEYDWIWQPNSIMFKPRRFIHTPVFGKQIHQFASPHWEFELTLPPTAEKDRRDIAAIMNDSQGVGVFNVYDPRVPIPAYYHSQRKSDSITSIVKPLTLIGATRSARTLTIQGVNGDRITKDDPFAFLHNGVKHYYRAVEDLLLDGTQQSIKVALTPRYDITGQSIAIDRIKPTCRFQIDINNMGDLTNADGFTSITLRGVEFAGSI